MNFTLAYRVYYTKKLPWHKERIYKIFDTIEEANGFLKPLDIAARQAGEYHDMPFIEEVGIIKNESGKRYCIGPCVDSEFTLRHI